MTYRVTIKKKDGSSEIFGDFISRYWATYHMAIAKMPNDGNIYKRPEYEGATWEITEEEDMK